MNNSPNPYGGTKSPSTTYAVYVGDRNVGFFTSRREANACYRKFERVTDEQVYVVRVNQTVIRVNQTVDQEEETREESVANAFQLVI